MKRTYRWMACCIVAVMAMSGGAWLLLPSLPAADRGPDEARLQKLTRKLGLQDKVEFRGFQPWDELVASLHKCHVFLNPSPKEGWGLTVVEANQCGLPVVASDRPGLKDSVRDGVTGALVPYGDAEAFAGEALKILRDPALFAERSAAAREWAGTFSWPRCVSESLELFREVAARRGRRVTS
jgi:glycosyltransferase involved in cell wall biosynthesis